MGTGTSVIPFLDSLEIVLSIVAQSLLVNFSTLSCDALYTLALALSTLALALTTLALAFSTLAIALSISLWVLSSLFCELPVHAPNVSS